jgi:hypothetical protein
MARRMAAESVAARTRKATPGRLMRRVRFLKRPIAYMLYQFVPVGNERTDRDRSRPNTIDEGVESPNSERERGSLAPERLEALMRIRIVREVIDEAELPGPMPAGLGS